MNGKFKVDSTKLRKYVLPNLPYALVFWFCTKLGMAYRLADGTDFLQKLTGLTRTINMAFTNLAPSFNSFDLMVGACGTTLLYAVVHFKKKNAKKWRKDAEYGTARWGNSEDIRPYTDPKPENNVILTQTESLTMNSRPKSPKHARNKNVLIVGGSGSGKTRFFIKPNLMQCESKSYPVSFVVTDPKGIL